MFVFAHSQEDGIALLCVDVVNDETWNMDYELLHISSPQVVGCPTILAFPWWSQHNFLHGLMEPIWTPVLNQPQDRKVNSPTPQILKFRNHQADD